MIWIFEIIIYLNKKINLFFNLNIFLYLKFFKFLNIKFILFFKLFFLNKKFYNKIFFDWLANIFSKPKLKKSIVIFFTSSFLDLSNFWINYQEKEKVEFFFTENYGNVASIKYDLRLYPFWILWLLKIDMTKIFNKVPRIDIFPILKKIEFFIWLIKINYNVYKLIFNYDFKINLINFKIIRLIGFIFLPNFLIDIIFKILINLVNFRVNLINFLFRKIYRFIIKNFSKKKIFIFFKTKQKIFHNILNYVLIKTYLLIIFLLEFFDFWFFDFLLEFFYKYFFTFLSNYFIIIIVIFKHFFLNIIDKLIPYIIKLFKFFIISIFEPYIKINFWWNYFYLKIEIIKIKIVNFYTLLELLKMNLIKKN